MGTTAATICASPRKLADKRRVRHQEPCTARFEIVAELPGLNRDTTVTASGSSVLPDWPALTRCSPGRNRGRLARQSQPFDDQLVALLGHELRAPVSGLRNNAELLACYLRDDLTSDEAQRTIGRIHSLSATLGLMIQDLFEMAQISAGKLAIVQHPIDPVDVVMSAVEVAESLPQTPPIVVETMVEGLRLHGDARRLSSVILNLLTNAAKHAAQTERIDVRIRSDAHDVLIDVEDYGPGIADDDLPLIFTKHYQARRQDRGGSRSEPAASGLGLGLFIAQRLVRAHHGHITVTSKLGLGTRFTIHLPQS